MVGYPTKDEKAALAAPKRKIKWGKVLGTTALGGLGLVVLVAAIAIVTLPGCLRRKCVEAAASRGVVLTVGDVRLGAGRFSLVDVSATSPELPGMGAKANELELEVAGLDVTKISAHGAELVVDGSYEQVAASIAKFRAAHKGALPGDAHGAGAPSARIVLDGTHLVWTRAFGEHVKLDALELRADVGKKGADDDVHVVSPHVLIDFDGAKVGPWRVTHDREGLEARSRIGFDPQLPDGPNALFVANGDRVSTVDVTIARTQLANVGVAPELLGLPSGGSTQVEANIHFGAPLPNRAEARAAVGLYAIKIGSVPTPLDAKLDLQIAGDPASGADVKKGTLAVGPLSGSVVGVLKVFDDGMRIDLGWKAGPLPCSAFVSIPPPPVPQGSPPGMNDIAHHLTQLAQATGIAKVTGEVRMEGTLAFDSRDFGHAKATFSPTNTCDLSLFGQK